MLPIIAIIGRPNVGKSTLFNRLTARRDALVADFPGVTRDRLYAEITVDAQNFMLIDTGGLSGEAEGIDGKMQEQSHLAIAEADLILMIVDGRSACTADDWDVAQRLRIADKPCLLVVNKSEGQDEDIVCADYHQLGLGAPIAISAAHGRGMSELSDAILTHFPMTDVVSESSASAVPEGEEGEDEVVISPAETVIRVAVAGRPNVGKSTLINRLLGEERVVVFDEPGTTRDSITIPFERRGQRYELIDTAGVRRRGRIDVAIEKFSVIKSLQAVREAHVVILVIDGREGLTEQDMRLMHFVAESGRSIILAINKWDNLSDDAKFQLKEALDRRLHFMRYAQWHFISALHGSGVGKLFKSIDQAWRSATVALTTSKVTAILEQAVTRYAPPMVRGRRIKLNFAHPRGQNPPTIVIHGKQTDSLPDSYVKYLNNAFAEALKLVGTPVRLQFKTADNPYQHKTNSLTERQIKRRKRLMKHVKR